MRGCNEGSGTRRVPLCAGMAGMGVRGNIGDGLGRRKGIGWGRPLLV